MTSDEILELAHRQAWRYRKSSDPHHSDTYTFNRSTLLEFARKLMTVERKAWMIAVTDEPELPGEMPDEMWDVIRNDRDAATEVLRIVVRQTKGGILKRGVRSNVEHNRRPQGVRVDGPVGPHTKEE